MPKFLRSEGVQAVLGADAPAPTPASHSSTTPLRLHGVFSQGRTERSQAGCFSAALPALGPKLGTHICSSHPMGAIRHVSPRGLRWRESWGWGMAPLGRLTSVLKRLDSIENLAWSNVKEPVWLHTWEVISTNEAPVLKCSSQIRVQGLWCSGRFFQMVTGCHSQY